MYQIGSKEKKANPIEIIVSSNGTADQDVYQQQKPASKNSTLKIIKKRCRKNSVMPTKATNQKLDSTYLLPKTERFSHTTIPKTNHIITKASQDENTFKPYNVSLQRVQLETWNSDYSHEDENQDSISICYNQPESPVKSENSKLLKTGTPDLWSNVEVKENINLGDEDKNGHFLSVSERKPNQEQPEQLSSSSIFVDVKDSEEIESLKSFEMNEIIHNISDDSINNESSNSESVKEFKDLEKIFLGSGEGEDPHEKTLPQEGIPLLLVDLENQIKFYERVEKSFYAELDKSISSHRLNLSSSNLSSDIDNSCANIKALFESDFGSNNLSIYGIYEGPIVGGEKKTFTEVECKEDLAKESLKLDSCESELESFLFSNDEVVNLLNDLVSKINQNNENNNENNNKTKEAGGVSVKIDINNNNINEIAVKSSYHEHEREEKKVEDYDNMTGNEVEKNSQLADELIFDKKFSSLSKFPQKSSISLHEHRSMLRRRHSSFNEAMPNSFGESKMYILRSLSPLKKRIRADDESIKINLGSGDLTEEFQDDEPNTYNENGDEDEFFLAITNDQMQTGSCPDFYWHSKLGKNFFKIIYQ